MALDLKRYENVLRKQTGKAVRPIRMDGYVNAINRYGTAKDDTEQYYYRPEPEVPDDVLEMFYENNGLFAKIIDTPAEEAVKHGFSLEGVEDQDLIKFYESALDELDWEETAINGLKWARLFGGSLAVMLINDGHALEEPVDWKHIKSIDDIVVYDRSVINPDRTSMYRYDPNDPFRTRGSRLGSPEWYEINSPSGNFIVHDSRCLTFKNGVLPMNALNETYQIWGIPEYVRIHRAVRNAEIAHESAPKMLSKSVQPVYKMKDLAMELATEEGEDKVLRRLQAIDMARGLLNSITIDSEGEDYSFQSFGFAGVSDVIESSCNWLSAITCIPQTILFGRSPAGMNATGESDFENYYNYVERLQKRILRPSLRYLLSVIFTAGKHTGEIKQIPELKVDFNPLWSMSETEEAQLESMKLQNELTRANIATTYIGAEVLDPKEIRVELGKEDPLDPETMLDDMSEEELLESAPQGQPGAEGEGNPMGAMTGGEAAAITGGGVPEPMQAPQNEDETAPNYAEYGNAPETAPEATKLPQDMEEQEPDHEDAESEDLDWITLENGVHVPIDPNGKAVGGPVEGADFSGAKSEENSSSASITKEEYERKHSEKTRTAIKSLLRRHTHGFKSQEDADYEIAHHIARKDAIGKAILDKAKLEEQAWVEHCEKAKKEKEETYERSLADLREAMQPGGYLENYSMEQLEDLGVLNPKPQYREPRFYRKGEIGSATMAFTTLDGGAKMGSPGSEGMEEGVGWDHSYTLSELKEMGYAPIAGIQAMDVGYPGEAEVMFAAVNPTSEQLDKLSHSPVTIYSLRGEERDRAIKEKDEIDTEKNKKLQALQEEYTKAMTSPEQKDISALAKKWSETLSEITGESTRKLTELGKKYGVSLGDNVVPYSMNDDSTLEDLSEDEDHEDADSDNDAQDPGGLVKRYAAPEYQPPFYENSDTEKWLVKDLDAIMSFVPDSDTNSPEWVDDEIKRRIRSVGVLVVDKNGKILSGTRKGGDGENYGLLGGPGGHVEPHESLEDAAIRETYEEFGIVMKDPIFISLGDYEEDSGMIPAIFLCTDWAGSIHPIDGEMENIRFRTIDEILSHKLFAPFKSSLEILESVLTNAEEGDIIELGKGEETRLDGNPVFARAVIGRAKSIGFEYPEDSSQTLPEAIKYLHDHEISPYDAFGDYLKNVKHQKDVGKSKNPNKDIPKNKRVKEGIETKQIGADPQPTDREKAAIQKEINHAKAFLPVYKSTYIGNWNEAQNTHAYVTKEEAKLRMYGAVKLGKVNGSSFPSLHSHYLEHIVDKPQKAFVGMSEEEFNEYAEKIAQSKPGRLVKGMLRNNGDIYRYDTQKNVLVVIDGKTKIITTCHELDEVKYPKLKNGALKGRAYYEFMKLAFRWR